MKTTGFVSELNPQAKGDDRDATRRMESSPNWVSTTAKLSQSIEGLSPEIPRRFHHSKTTKSSLKRQNTSPPRYVPSYLIPLGGFCRSSRISTDESKISKRLDSSGPERNRSNLTLEEIRKKYQTGIYAQAVPVKEKVALMEKRNHNVEATKPKVPTKRVTSADVSNHTQAAVTQQTKIPYRGQLRPLGELKKSGGQPPVKPKRASRENRHRRSMSDPNLHKSFQAVKELWDKKAEADTRTHVVLSPRTSKSRGGSVSSNHSVESESGGKYQKEPQPARGSFIKVSATAGLKKGPPIPVKPPKPAQLRPRENNTKDIRKQAHSSADQTGAGNLVKNRAKLFDGGTENKKSSDMSKSSLNRSKGRSTTVDESHSVSARKSAIENAVKQDKSPTSKHSGNNNEKADDKSELVRLLDYEESQQREAGEDLMSSVRRNSANRAKERRRQHQHRRGSNHSDSDTSSVASSLSSASVEGPVVLRRTGSREERIMDKSTNSSPVVKSYLHRKASPKITPNSPTQAPEPRPRNGSIGFAGSRRGSLGSIVSSGSVSGNLTAPRRQSSLHKDHTSNSNQSLTELETPTATLQRKLSIDAAKRVSMSTDSGTGSVSPAIDRNSRSSAKSAGYLDSISSGPENFRRGGSFSSSSSTIKTPPVPPPSSDKPGRPRSASSSPIPLHRTVTPARPTVPPPPPPLKHKREASGSPQVNDNDSMGSTTTISSKMSLLSGLGDGEFNAEDEYNRILNVISTPSASTRLRKDSPSSSEGGEENGQSTNSGTVTGPIKPEPVSNRDSLEVPSRKSRASDNDSCSDYEHSDADEEGNHGALMPMTENPSVAEASPMQKVPIEVKLHNIAKELLSTEITYVDVLHLIDQIFHKRVLEAVSKKQISSDVKNIFSNVSAIYQFHNEFLLPQLKTRLASWDTNPKLGDIMTQAAPFLKMYSLYVQNFDEAMTMVKHWSEKSNNFANIIKQTQAMEECGNLSLEHHMLSPVQRIPRYKMLLEDYLKRLPEDSPDRPEAETALQLISQAATHSNESMRQSDKFNKLLSIYNNLVDINFDIVDVSRELIMDGKIIKISARNGEKHERYLYLFNDMLLVCTPLRRLQKKSYKVTAKIDLDGMEITDVANMTIPNTFCVNGTKKSLEFAANSPDEKEKWVNAITDAIDSFVERKTSFMKSPSVKCPAAITISEQLPASPLHAPDNQTQFKAPLSPVSSPIHGPMFDELDLGTEEKRIEITLTHGNQYVVDIEDRDLGKRAPRWIKDNEVTMCMNCSKTFNVLLRRRHHCRACGRVICTECSEHKLELAYEKGKTHKVCNKCYAILTGRKNTDTDKKSVLQVEADIVSGDSIISEYLHFTDSDKKKAWTKMWCVIPKHEPCLYVYGANQDVRAMMTMPLPGFTIVEDATIDRDYSFKLAQARKVMLFAASSQEQKDRWKFVFEKVASGQELTRDEVYQHGKPHEYQTDSQESAGSRLSSSSGESSNTSSSDNSRPSSFMSKPSSYSDMNCNTDHEGQNIIQGTVAS